MRQLRGKRALITGAASGIGRAIALRLAKEGIDLFLVDIDEAGLANTVDEIHRAGVEVVGQRCDVSRPEEVSATIAAVLDRWSGVDILVNNAGITYYGGTDRMSAEHWDQVVSVNLLSHIQFTRELLPSLLARREAHVINVCSILGLIGMPKVNAYCTTKFALVGFSESLRSEFGRQGLGVTALCPGFVKTKLFSSAPLEESVTQHKIPPKPVCTTPEAVANAAIKAIRRNRAVVVVEPLAHVMWRVKRFAPWLLDMVLHIGRRKRMAKKLKAVGPDLAEEAAVVSISTQVAQQSTPKKSAA